MKNELRRLPLFLTFLLSVFFLFSCSDEDKITDSIPGLWKLNSVTEDGQAMTLTSKEQSLKMLVETNGVYRTIATDGVSAESHFGAWSTTDDQWLELSVDTWHAAKNPLAIKDTTQRWVSNHLPIRFTIMSASDEELIIRLKTFVGEKKYSSLFVANARPNIVEENVDDIINEFQNIKTYIFTFKKQK